MADQTTVLTAQDVFLSYGETQALAGINITLTAGVSRWR